MVIHLKTPETVVCPRFTSLKVVFEGDDVLINPYHVMAVNPAKHPGVRYDLATKYIEFVTSKQGQAIIKGFNKGGQQLFYPDAM
jgi:tungstate transport system substrate-binding protein